MFVCARIKFLSVKRVDENERENENEMCDNVHTEKVFRRQKKQQKVVKKVNRIAKA